MSIPLSAHLYRRFIHCAHTDAADAWRAEHEQTSGVDPCTAPDPLAERTLPFLFTSALAFTVTAVVSVERRRRS